MANGRRYIAEHTDNVTKCTHEEPEALELLSQNAYSLDLVPIPRYGLFPTRTEFQ